MLAVIELIAVLIFAVLAVRKLNRDLQSWEDKHVSTLTNSKQFVSDITTRKLPDHEVEDLR